VLSLNLFVSVTFMLSASTSPTTGISVDDAALHPDLRRRFGDGYFGQCASARRHLKALLTRHLGISHDLFLVSNTTHGLLTALTGLALDGISLDVSNASYPGYQCLPTWPETANVFRKTKLLTHVDPLSGVVTEIPKRQALPTVADAAQSFATISYHNDAMLADIFFCPLHKHAGIGSGLGILAISPSCRIPSLMNVASVSENGTSALSLLCEAIEEIERRNGHIMNRLVVNVGEELRRSLNEHNIEVLTPPGAALPFICLRGINPYRLRDADCPDCFSVKFFKEQGITRISGAVRGSIYSTPADRSSDLADFVLRSICRK
jgi:hypothetical protein